MLAKNINVGDMLRATRDKNNGKIMEGSVIKVLEIDKSEKQAQIKVRAWDYKNSRHCMLWTSILNLEKVKG